MNLPDSYLGRASQRLIYFTVLRSDACGTSGGSGKTEGRLPGGGMSILPPWSMAAERPHMAARYCKWRYRSMVQLCHIPRRRMRLLSTPPQNSAMSQVERRQPALTSSGPMTNSAPCTRVADFRALVMSLLLMYHRGPDGISRYVPKGALWRAPCLRSNKQSSAKPTTGHAWRAPLRAGPKISPVPRSSAR